MRARSSAERPRERGCSWIYIHCVRAPRAKHFFDTAGSFVPPVITTMRLVAVTAVFFLFLALIKGQRFGGYGFPQGFGGGLDASLGIRDPRQNTGPVVFPPAPPDNGETSGVVPGASGYGFVPPSQGAGRLQGLHSFF